MKRVLLDQGLSPQSAKLLREADWDAHQGAAVSADLKSIRVRALPFR